MIVKDFLKRCANDTYIKIYQVPTKEIDNSGRLVCRQVGEVTTLLDSNQNYLSFHVENVKIDDGLLTVVCKADEQQCGV